MCHKTYFIIFPQMHVTNITKYNRPLTNQQAYQLSFLVCPLYTHTRTHTINQQTQVLEWSYVTALASICYISSSLQIWTQGKYQVLIRYALTDLPIFNNLNQLSPPQSHPECQNLLIHIVVELSATWIVIIPPFLVMRTSWFHKLKNYQIFDQIKKKREGLCHKTENN